MIPLCIQYKKAKAGKMMLFYDPKQNRWLISKENRLKISLNLLKSFESWKKVRYLPCVCNGRQTQKLKKLVRNNLNQPDYSVHLCWAFYLK